MRFWLKSRGEEQLSSRCDVGTSPEAVKGLLEQHDKFEAKAKVSYYEAWRGCTEQP